MKRFILVLITLLLCSSLIAEEELKGQILPFNEDANEEVIIINNSSRSEAFKIYVHTISGSVHHFNGFAANSTTTTEGWNYLTKSPEIQSESKWKSSNDFEVLELSDYICIESKSGKKYNYTFETKHDKLYITVSDFAEGDDW